MADLIGIRFGALDRRLAATVRHALDTAVTYTALAPMNAVHLRMTLIAEILDFEAPPEPPSHRWYEFMGGCFGRNSVGLQNLTVRPSDSRSGAAALVHIDFAESYVTNETEERIIHDLLVAAGAFLVAESTVMDEQIEKWNIAGRDGFLSEELCSIAGRAGVVGFDLLEHAEAGTWRDLLSTVTREPDAVITNAEETHAPSAPAEALSRTNLSRVGERFDTENPDYIVLMVDLVEANHRQALTALALSKLREAANNHNESSSIDSVVVVSPSDGRQATSLPLTSQQLDKSLEEDSSSESSIEQTLDRVAQLVEVLSQPADAVSTIATSVTQPHGEQRDLITGIHSAACTYDPVLLIILSSEYNSISRLDLKSKPDPRSSPKELVEILRDHDRLPDLHGVSVIFLWPAPSPETYLDAYWLAICTAAGALSCEFHFSSSKRGLVSVSPAGGPFCAENASAAPPAPSAFRSRESPVRAGHGSTAIGVSGVRLGDEGPVGAPVEDEGSLQSTEPEHIASVVEPPPAGGLLSYIFANNHRTRRALILAASTAVIVIVVILTVIAGIRAVGAMTDTILFLAGATVVLGVGVLIGSSLHTRSIDQRYRHLAQRARQLNVRETAVDARCYCIPPRSAVGYPPEIHQWALLSERPPLFDDD